MALAEWRLGEMRATLDIEMVEVSIWHGEDDHRLPPRALEASVRSSAMVNPISKPLDDPHQSASANVTRSHQGH
jgi:hypothetical protein